MHQVKLKVDDNSCACYNLFTKGPPELALNHIIIYMDVAKSHHLDNIVELSNALLKTKKADYNSLPAQRSKTSKRMKKEMKDWKRTY